MRYIILPTYHDEDEGGCCLIPLTPARIQELQLRKEVYDKLREQGHGVSEIAFVDEEQHWLSISAESLLEAEQIESTELDSRRWDVVDIAEAVVLDEQHQTEFRTELERCCIDEGTFSWECDMKYGGRITTQPLHWSALGYLLDLAHGTPIR